MTVPVPPPPAANAVQALVETLFDQPSDFLVANYPTLPDAAANTPLCKYYVFRVLSHRTDKQAKKFISTFMGSKSMRDHIKSIKMPSAP